MVTFPLAQTGEGIAECELIHWHVEEGSTVQEFDPLCEVQSDKASVEITSRYAGVIKRLYGEVGDMIAVGAPLIDILVESAEVGASESVPQALPEADAAPVRAGVERAHCSTAQSALEPRALEPGIDGAGAGGRAPTLACPSVRAIAREHRLDLADVAGSGPKGRILKSDVLQHLEALSGSSEPKGGAEGAGDAASGAAMAAAPGANVVPLRGYRRAMVKSMTASAAIPHFHFCDEVRMDEVMTLRRRLLALRGGAPMTVLPILIKALSVAMSQHPELNAQLSPGLDALHVIQDHNIGIAMATPMGLVVPNIKRAQTLGIADIADEIVRLRDAAATSQLQPGDLQGTTISVSNIGTIGGTYACPLVNPPEIAICALGKLRTVPIYDAALQAQAGTVMNISWGADHRAIDGASLAKFSNTWKDLVENPAALLLHMS